MNQQEFIPGGILASIQPSKTGILFLYIAVNVSWFINNNYFPFTFLQWHLNFLELQSMASKSKLKTTDRREEFMNSPKKETKSNVRFDVAKAANASNDSIDSLDNTASTPLRVSREDVLSSLGYHPGRAQKLMATPTSYQRSDTCHYCGKKVYPLEKMDVGELYHRGCFRCHVCGLQLTLKTFCRVADKSSNKVKEVYCKTHVPKDGFSIDRHTIEINAAINAQKKASEKVGCLKRLQMLWIFKFSNRIHYCFCHKQMQIDSVFNFRTTILTAKLLSCLYLTIIYLVD